MKLAAAPKGQSRAVENWFWIRLPIMTVLPPPIRSGVRYAPRQGTNTRIAPAMMPALVIGIVTRVKARKGRAPRSAAASSSAGSSRSRIAKMGSTMNGR